MTQEPASQERDQLAQSPQTAEPEPRDQIWTIPNLISFGRLALVPVFAWAIFTRHDGIALLCVMLSGITDYLDGYLARRLNQLSKLGQSLDPAADRLFILATLLGLGHRDLVPWWVVILIVGRDVALVLGTAPVLRRVGARNLPVHFLGKAATFNLLYAFPLLLMSDGPTTWHLVAGVLGWAFAWWGIGLYWWAGYLYAKQAFALHRYLQTA